MEIFIDAPNLLKAYDYAVMISCPDITEQHDPFFAELATELEYLERSFLLVLVTDAANEPLKDVVKRHFSGRRPVDVQFLPVNNCRRNQQLALLSGLNYIHNTKCTHCIVMRTDSGDDPRAIRELIKTTDKDVVFVNKGPKAGNLLFWLIYRFHHFFFWLLTNQQIEVDHYSMINRKAMDSLVDKPFLHYTTTLHLRPLLTAQIRHEHRNQSFGRETKRLFRNTVASLLEFGENLLDTFLRFSLTMGFLFFACLCYGVFARLTIGVSFPDWATIALVILFTGTLLNIGFFTLGIMILNRYQMNSHPYQLPLRRFPISIGIADN